MRNELSDGAVLLAGLVRVLVPAYLDAEAERIRLLQAAGQTEAAIDAAGRRDEMVRTAEAAWGQVVDGPLTVSQALRDVGAEGGDPAPAAPPAPTT